MKYIEFIYPELQSIQKLAKKKKVDIFLIGGFVRDVLLNRKSFDLDFAVSKNGLALAQEVANQINGAYVLLDEDRGCARVVKKYKQATVTFDFANFREKSFNNDLKKRDYTINTFYVDFLKWDVTKSIKSFIKGSSQAKEDLKNKCIRMVNAQTFKDDPLRLMRGFSLFALLGFSMEPKTKKQIKEDGHLLIDVSLERVRDELFKILQSPRTFKTFKAMDRIGLLSKVIPQITVMYNVVQGGYHHLDVWPHSLEVVNQAEKILKKETESVELSDYLNECISGNRPRYALLKLGCLLHDIGKPDTKKVEKGRMSFHSHEHVGRRITKIIGKDLKLSSLERRVLEDTVQLHLRPGYLSNFKEPSQRSVYRYFRDAKNEAVSILLLSLADQRSTRGPLTTQDVQDHHEKICKNAINLWFEKQKEQPKKRLLTGDDLIRKFKLKPSPKFKEILASVDEAQELGKLSNKQQAYEFVRLKYVA